MRPIPIGRRAVRGTAFGSVGAAAGSVIALTIALVWALPLSIFVGPVAVVATAAFFVGVITARETRQTAALLDAEDTFASFASMVERSKLPDADRAEIMKTALREAMKVAIPPARRGDGRRPAEIARRDDT